jgi:hypothetical protein
MMASELTAGSTKPATQMLTSCLLVVQGIYGIDHPKTPRRLTKMAPALAGVFAGWRTDWRTSTKIPANGGCVIVSKTVIRR